MKEKFVRTALNVRHIGTVNVKIEYYFIVLVRTSEGGDMVRNEWSWKLKTKSNLRNSEGCGEGISCRCRVRNKMWTVKRWLEMCNWNEGKSIGSGWASYQVIFSFFAPRPLLVDLGTYIRRCTRYSALLHSFFPFHASPFALSYVDPCASVRMFTKRVLNWIRERVDIGSFSGCFRRFRCDLLRLVFDSHFVGSFFSASHVSSNLNEFMNAFWSYSANFGVIIFVVFYRTDCIFRWPGAKRASFHSSSLTEL